MQDDSENILDQTSGILTTQVHSEYHDIAVKTLRVQVTVNIGGIEIDSVTVDVQLEVKMCNSAPYCDHISCI